MNMRFESLHRTLVACIPDSQRFIVRCADDELAARMEDNGAYPIIVSNKGKEAYPSTDIPYTNHLISRTRREKRSFVCTLIVCSSSSIDRCSCAIRCPRDTFHYVIMISEFDLIIQTIICITNKCCNKIYRYVCRELMRHKITFVSFVAICHIRTV